MYLKWEIKFETGVKEIDEQHKRLFKIINELYQNIRDGKNLKSLVETFIKLIDYTNYHFKSEEKIMLKFGYEKYREHRNQHLGFIEKLTQLGEDFESGKTLVNLKLLNYLKEWVINHVQVEDKKYISSIKNHQNQTA